MAQTSQHQNIVATLPPESPPGSTASGAVPGLAHSCAPAAPGDVAGTPAEGRPAQPAARRRLVGIDAARGVALVGMMSVHLITPATEDGDVTLAWLLSNGTASALFALLAGVGIAFTSGGRRPVRGLAWRASALSLLTRAVIIAAVGLALGYVIGTDDAAVILAYYGVMFALTIPFLRLSTRGLAIAAGVVAIGAPILSQVLRSGMAPVEETNPTLTDLVTHPLALLSQLTLTGVFPAMVWLAYLLAGMAAGRALLSSRRVVGQITLIGLALALGAKLVSMLLMTIGGGGSALRTDALQSMDFEDYQDTLIWGPTGTTPTNSSWWLATVAPHSGSPLDMVFTIGVALAVLGACLLLGRGLQPLLRPLAAAGSMTLTLYSAHLLMVAAPITRGVGNWVVQVLLVVTFALLWSRMHARGPLEELVWRITGGVRRKVLASAGAHRAPDAGSA